MVENATSQQAGPKDWTTVGEKGPEVAQRLNRVMGPLMAGVIIDLFDILTLGPVGIVFGVPIGGAAGYWLGKCLGLSTRACWGCAAAAAIYCSVPFTEFVPLGSLIGAYVRFMEGSGASADTTSATTTVDGTVIGSNFVDEA